MTSAVRKFTSKVSHLSIVRTAPAPVKRKRRKKSKAKFGRNWSRIPADKVRLARSLLAKGYLRKPIGNLLGIHETTVGLIARGLR